MKCQAKEMGLEHFGDDAVVPCEAEGTVNVVGYWLCVGCDVALRVVIGLSNLVIPKKPRDDQ